MPPFRRVRRLHAQLLGGEVTTAAVMKSVPTAAAPAPAETTPAPVLSLSGGQHMTITPITGTFGARVEQVDIADLSANAVQKLKEALSKYKLLVIEGCEHIQPPQLRDFAAHWGPGETARHPNHKQVEGCPEVYIIDGSEKSYKTGLNVGSSWHRDGPPRAKTEWLTFLQAKAVPEAGRDTLFADMEAAYERLSPSLQAYLDTLTAQNDWGGQMRTAGPDYPKNGYAHPVVMTDEQGRKSIYVDQTYTRKINGLRKEESDWLLSYLWNLTDIPELQCRVHWNPGTMIIWDNEKTQHYLVRDLKYDRVLHRVMNNCRPLDSQSRGQDLTSH